MLWNTLVGPRRMTTSGLSFPSLSGLGWACHSYRACQLLCTYCRWLWIFAIIWHWIPSPGVNFILAFCKMLWKNATKILICISNGIKSPSASIFHAKKSRPFSSFMVEFLSGEISKWVVFMSRPEHHLSQHSALLGPSITDVSQIFGIFAPPPLSAFGADIQYWIT